MKITKIGTNNNSTRISNNSTPAKRKASKLFKLFLIGVAVCAVASIGGTFAWFTSSSNTQVPTIQAARYDIKATERNDGVTFEKVGNSYSALFDPRELPYDIQLEETAGSTATTGYCKIECNGEVIYTEQFPSESNTDGIFRFYVAIYDSPAEVKITPHWGIHNPSSEDEKLITEGKALVISGASVKVQELEAGSPEGGESDPDGTEPLGGEEGSEQGGSSAPEAPNAPEDVPEAPTQPGDVTDETDPPEKEPEVPQEP